MLSTIAAIALAREPLQLKGLDRIPAFDYIDQLDDGVKRDLNDPLLTIQVTNEMIPLGTKRAIDALEKISRGPFRSHSFDTFFFWLARVLFEGNEPNYRFPYPAIGAISPQEPRNPETWPTYPVRVFGDVPFNFYAGATLMGKAGPFSYYLEKNSSSWAMRKNALKPPDDPFLLEKSFPYPDAKDLDKTQVRREIIRLVRSAYKLKQSKPVVRNLSDDAEFERAHQDFLKAGGHWNPKLNLYVRRDGTYDKDKFVSPPSSGKK